MTCRAALIDLDGTLLDTAPDLAAAVNATLKDLGLAPLPKERIRDFVGKGLGHLMRQALVEARGRVPEPVLEERAREALAHHYERFNGVASRPFPGVVEGLAALRAHGLKLACVTNKVMAFTSPLLEATGLRASFDAVVTSDLAGARKPDPAVFLHACRALDVAPGEACVIGDSDNDGDAARAAGCRFLLVPYGYREGRRVEDMRCDAVVADLGAAAALLRREQP